MNIKNKIIIGIIILFSTACTQSTTTSSTIHVDESIAKLLNSQENSVIDPGAIPVVVQELGEECTLAVAPLRDLMAEFASVRQVTPVNKFEQAFGPAKAACETASPQEWTDFYLLELTGWIKGVSQETISKTPVTTTTTIDSNVSTTVNMSNK
jgi:hypothetical protein